MELVNGRVRLRDPCFWLQILTFLGSLCKPHGPTPSAADFFLVPSDVPVRSRAGSLPIKYPDAWTDEQEMRLLMLRGMESRCLFFFFSRILGRVASFCPSLPYVLLVSMETPNQCGICCFMSLLLLGSYKVEIAFKRFAESVSMLTRIQV